MERVFIIYSSYNRSLYASIDNGPSNIPLDIRPRQNSTQITHRRSKKASLDLCSLFNSSIDQVEIWQGGTDPQSGRPRLQRMWAERSVSGGNFRSPLTPPSVTPLTSARAHATSRSRSTVFFIKPRPRSPDFLARSASFSAPAPLTCSALRQISAWSTQYLMGETTTVILSH